MPYSQATALFPPLSLDHFTRLPCSHKEHTGCLRYYSSCCICLRARIEKVLDSADRYKGIPAHGAIAYYCSECRGCAPIIRPEPYETSIIPPEQQQQQQQPYFNITRPFNGCEPAKLLPESISWDQNTCQMHSGKPPTRRHSNVASGFQLTANDIPNSTGLLQQGVHFSSLATSSKTEARTSYAVAPTLSTTNPNHSEYQFLDDHKEFSSNRSQEQSASKRKQLLTPLSKKLRKLIQQFADTTIDKVHSARKRSTLFSTATRNGDSFTESNLFWAMATGCRSEGAQRHAKGRVNLQIYDEFLTPSTSVQTSPKAREKKVDARRARRVELRLGRQYEAWSSTYKG